jgi:hypothetical protein
VRVENLLDELWVGVKGVSNVEIAGSPRNSFRDSLVSYLPGVELLIELGRLPPYRLLSNSEYGQSYHGSQNVRDKLHARKGKSPDRRLRPRIPVKLKAVGTQ